jgi:aspartate/methionine/tyrosine aminotransferase
MYQWVVVHVDKHPRFRKEGGSGCNTLELMNELYDRLVREAKVMVMPGHLFVVCDEGEDGSKDTNHLRVCVSAYASSTMTVKADVPSSQATWPILSKGSRRWVPSFR